MRALQRDIKFEIEWTTLGEYLDHLVARGVSPNVASFVGATTVRIHELGYEDRPPTPEELARMQALVRDAMREGALGVGSSLIYAPAFYARTDELIALARAGAEQGGMYISHMRSEGNRLLESVDEVISIARAAGSRAEIYHLKAAGEENWPKLDQVIARVNAARASGLAITADMYTYTAAATGLDAAMPPWVQEGGYLRWAERLRDPRIRARVKREMNSPTDRWENFYRSPRLRGSCWSASRPIRSNSTPASRWRRWRGSGTARRRRPRWTSSPGTAAGSKRSTSSCRRTIFASRSRCRG